MTVPSMRSRCRRSASSPRSASFLYLILRCVFDGIGMIFLTNPVFYPIVNALGFDLIRFGIIVGIVVELGLMTPPVAMNVFVMESLAPGFSGVMPFVLAALVCLALVIAFPDIALVLTRFM